MHRSAAVRLRRPQLRVPWLKRVSVVRMAIASGRKVQSSTTACIVAQNLRLASLSGSADGRCHSADAQHVRAAATVVSSVVSRIHVRPSDRREQSGQTVPHVEASANIFDCRACAGFSSGCSSDKARASSLTKREDSLRQLLDWQGASGTSTAARSHFCDAGLVEPGLTSRRTVQKPGGLEAVLGNARRHDSLEGRVRYQGGDLLAKVDACTRAAHARGLPPPPRQRRLPRRQGRQGPRRRRGPGRPRPGLRTLEEDAGVSAVAQGHEAGHEGGSAQAGTEGVRAPGRQGRRRCASSTPWPRRCRRASDGDTIEIRGNGPFVTRAHQDQRQR